jgi:tetratricopeptide (TPR) repeat protein
MKHPIVLLLVVSSLLAACTSEKEKLSKAIAAKEKELLADSVRSVDRVKAKEMIALYRQYAEKYKDDTLSNEYIFRAADISNGIGEYREAIALYKTVADRPEFRKHAVALFLQGFIYENQLTDYFQARTIYQKFLDKYPDHPLANDVRYSMENLGKSPEELIKAFEKKQVSPDSVATR